MVKTAGGRFCERPSCGQRSSAVGHEWSGGSSAIL